MTSVQRLWESYMIQLERMLIVAIIEFYRIKLLLDHNATIGKQRLNVTNIELI